MRLFVAIDLSDPARDALAAVQDDLTTGRRTDPETFHVTLAFLGEEDADTAEEVALELESLRAPAFDLTLSGFDTFGGASPAVLVSTVADAGPVTALHQAVRRRLRQAGVELSRERFRPHVTIARMPRRMHEGQMAALHLFLSRNAAWRGDPFRVTSFALYQSHLSPDGAEHEELARFPLTMP